MASSGPSGDCGQVKLYRAVKPLIPPTGLVRMPCGTCPVCNDDDFLSVLYHDLLQISEIATDFRDCYTVLESFSTTGSC